MLLAQLYIISLFMVNALWYYLLTGNLYMAEQVAEVREADPVRNLWQQVVVAPRSCWQFK